MWSYRWAKRAPENTSTTLVTKASWVGPILDHARDASLDTREATKHHRNNTNSNGRISPLSLLLLFSLFFIFFQATLKNWLYDQRTSIELISTYTFSGKSRGKNVKRRLDRTPPICRNFTWPSAQIRPTSVYCSEALGLQQVCSRRTSNSVQRSKPTIGDARLWLKRCDKNSKL